MGNNIWEKAQLMRSSVINSAQNIEDTLTIILGHWYSPSKSDCEIIVNRLTKEVLVELSFDKKIKLFESFVDEFPTLFPKTIVSDLNKIRTTRNQLAHRTFLDPTQIREPGDEIIMKEGEFIFDKIGKSDFIFKLDDLDKFEKLCSETNMEIFILASKVSFALRAKDALN
jgi:hypothetical protein